MLGNTSFRTKLLLHSLLVSGLAVLLTAVAIRVLVQRTEHQALLQNRGNMVERLAASVASSLVFDDHDYAKRVIDSLAADQSVMQVCLYNADGELFHRFSGAPSAPPCRADAGGEEGSREDLLTITRTVYSTVGDRLGQLTVVSDLIAQRVRNEQISLLAVGVALTSFLIALALSLRLLRALTRPLSHLAVSVRRVAREENYALTIDKLADDEIGELTDDFNLMLAAIQRRNTALLANEARLAALNRSLESQVRVRTEELQNSYDELEALSYSMSHDLRAPLRGIAGFSQLLQGRATELTPKNAGYLDTIHDGATQMSEMLDDLVWLLRVVRQPVVRKAVDLGAIARTIADDLQRGEPGRVVDFAIADDLHTQAEPGFIKIMLDNLLGNAWKYSRNTENARIEFASETRDGGLCWYVRDNGAGFDMAYADKLFTPFGRLHSSREFGGNGIGLAIVARVVKRHGGRIWAEAELGAGACFWFTLGD